MPMFITANIKGFRQVKKYKAARKYEYSILSQVAHSSNKFSSKNSSTDEWTWLTVNSNANGNQQTMKAITITPTITVILKVKFG